MLRSSSRLRSTPYNLSIRDSSLGKVYVVYVVYVVYTLFHHETSGWVPQIHREAGFSAPIMHRVGAYTHVWVDEWWLVLTKLLTYRQLWDILMRSMGFNSWARRQCTCPRTKLSDVMIQICRSNSQSGDLLMHTRDFGGGYLCGYVGGRDYLGWLMGTLMLLWEYLCTWYFVAILVTYCVSSYYSRARFIGTGILFPIPHSP